MLCIRPISLVALVLGLVLAPSGCKGRDDLDGSRRRLPGLAERGEELSLPLEGEPAIELFDNRATMLRYAGGALVIECGSADFATLTEGGYRAPWHLGKHIDGSLAALVDGLAGELFVPIDDDPGGIAREPGGGIAIELELRPATPTQLVSVFLNEQKLGDVAMTGTAWKTYRIVAPANVVKPGENKLRFYFRDAGDLGGERSAAAFRRIRFGGAGGEPARASAIERAGKILSGFETRGPARLSFHVMVPESEPALVLAVAAAGQDAAAELAVHVASGERGEHHATAWSARVGAAWQTARIDLAEYAGDIVRIDLTGSAAAAWGRPVITRAAAPAPAVAQRRFADHVIVWSIAALRADRLGADAAHMPALARFAARATRFEHAVAASSAPGPANVALMGGRRPENDRVPAAATTLGERFREAGYTTALISGNGFVNDEAGFAQGMDLYHNPMRLRHPFQASLLWQKARRLLTDHAADRTFVYVATVEPHLPYTPSPESLAREWSGPARHPPAQTASLSADVAAGKRALTDEDRRYLTALYDAEVRDADEAFAEMLADVDKLGLRDRTAIIVVADHGEELFEHGGFGHGGTLYEEVLRVPLIIATPGQLAGTEPGVTIARPVELVDVYATALDLAGIAPSADASGRSALSPPGGDPAARPLFATLPGRARSVTVGRFKLIAPVAGDRSLYDLTADPGERRDLMGQRPLVERYLRNALGLEIAYGTSWNLRRWGIATNTKAAFPSDHGL